MRLPVGVLSNKGTCGLSMPSTPCASQWRRLSGIAVGTSDNEDRPDPCVVPKARTETPFGGSRSGIPMSTARGHFQAPTTSRPADSDRVRKSSPLCAHEEAADRPGTVAQIEIEGDAGRTGSDAAEQHQPPQAGVTLPVVANLGGSGAAFQACPVVMSAKPLPVPHCVPFWPTAIRKRGEAALTE